MKANQIEKIFYVYEHFDNFSSHQAHIRTNRTLAQALWGTQILRNYTETRKKSLNE